jgi:hypothetical protein
MRRKTVSQERTHAAEVNRRPLLFGCSAIASPVLAIRTKPLAFVGATFRCSVVESGDRFGRFKPLGI